MLSVIVLLVILASSVMLVYKLGGLTGDIMTSKHEEARIFVEQYRTQGKSFKQIAPLLVDQLSGLGLRVAVFDIKGRYLSGDKELHQSVLDQFAGSNVARETPTYNDLMQAVIPKNGKTASYIYKPPFDMFAGPPGSSNAFDPRGEADAIALSR